MSIIETSLVLNQVISAFEELSIDYFITGSIASGVRGEFRATNDIDILAAIEPEDTDKFVDLVEQDFYADRISIANAIASRRSFNIVHKESIIKVDIFTKIDDLQTEQLKRATSVEMQDINKLVKIATAEDVIISKLVWFEKGGRSSERQWRDMLGVVSVSGTSLDTEYILFWSEKLNIRDLAKEVLGLD